MNWLIRSNNINNSSLNRDEKACLLNADRFIYTSGQKGYFYEVKLQLNFEVSRLNELNQKLYYKKKENKRKYLEVSSEYLKTKTRLEKEIENYREKVLFT